LIEKRYEPELLGALHAVRVAWSTAVTVVVADRYIQILTKVECARFMNTLHSNCTISCTILSQITPR